MQRPWRSARQRLAGRARLWARRRQGTDPSRLTLGSERIYIVPTLAGLTYALMLATMLAGSMNYNNNLGFALTFLLAAVGVVTIHHTHRNLCGLRLHYLGADPVHAGDPLDVRFSLVNDAGTARDEIFLAWDGGADAAGNVPALDSHTVSLPLPTHRRGPLELPALRVVSRAPLGLMRAWTWIHLGERPLVYPRPAASATLPRDRDSATPGNVARRAGDDEFAGLRDYRPGDSPRRIAWKSYARTGVLLAREYRGGGNTEPIWLEWDDVPGPGTEERVAQLTRLVLDALAEGRAVGLRVPGAVVPPATGRDQLHRCLRPLAVTGLPVERTA